VTADCGLVVQALLIPQKTNPQLVDRMQVGVVNQSSGYRMEVEKSAKNTKAPSL
jgi:hypothetical protein